MKEQIYELQDWFDQEIRDRIMNKIIRFCLKHCGLWSSTVRDFCAKCSYGELIAYKQKGDK